jgi:hypothetical protein
MRRWQEVKEDYPFMASEREHAQSEFTCIASRRKCVNIRVDTKFCDTKFRKISQYEISHQEFISYFPKLSVYFAKFREISRPSFAKFHEIKMEIVSEIL